MQTRLVPMLLLKQSMDMSEDSVRFLSDFFTLRAVKGFVWFRVLMTRTRELKTQICVGKRTVHERETGHWVPVNAFIQLYTLKKNLFTPVQRSRPRLLP